MRRTVEGMCVRTQEKECRLWKRSVCERIGKRRRVVTHVKVGERGAGLRQRFVAAEIGND